LKIAPLLVLFHQQRLGTLTLAAVVGGLMLIACLIPTTAKSIFEVIIKNDAL